MHWNKNNENKPAASCHNKQALMATAGQHRDAVSPDSAEIDIWYIG